MDSENNCLHLASLEDDEETKNVPVLEDLENVGESEVDVANLENNISNVLIPVVGGDKEMEDSDSVRSHSMDMISEVFPSPAGTRKGNGLKKWRRIKRDIKCGDGSEGTAKMAMPDLSDSVVNPNKRTQLYADRQQKSEGSVSSPNPLVENLDAFALFGDSGIAMGRSVNAGTDSENSEDHSSKSSTAASVPKVKCEIPMVVGFPHDKNRMKSLGRKNLTPSRQHGQHVKGGQIEATKKSRGEWVKIEKENSHWSMESDLRSLNFVFMQGSYATRNGGSEGYKNGHQVQGSSEGQFGEYEDKESGDLKERSENRGSSSDQDSLVESIFELQQAQEALEEELLKFKEIGKDTSADGSLSDTRSDFTIMENKSFEQFPSGEGVLILSPSRQSELLGIAKRNAEAELENLFKRRIEAEVEYLAISRSIRKPRVGDQSTAPEEQRSAASKLTVNKIEDTMLKNLHEDIESADENLKLQKSVCKYTSCFFVQVLSLLFIVFGVFIFQLSRNYVEVVPT
ncbi:hypothetical protein OROGR_007182 [Orobanche gracilis]